MPRKIPSLNAVRAFEAAARHVSFTKAAQELHVTHGAVSRQVALLETWLGILLFRRAAAQLTLTDAGRTYAVEITSLLDRLAVVSVRLIDQAASAKLGVNGPPTFIMRWLIARMSAFQRQRPDAEIQLTTSLAPVNFEENDYHVAIRGAHAPLPGCRSQAFMTEVIVPVCHTDLMEGERLKNPQDLRHQTLISYATQPYAWDAWLANVGLDDMPVVAVLEFEQMYFALQAALEGLGVVLVPLFLVVDDIVNGRLCAPFGPLGAMRRRYYANSSQASSARSPLVDGFYDWLIREGRATEASIDQWTREMGWSMPPVD